MIGALACDLLRRHVLGRAQDHAGHRLDFVGAHARDAEVGDLHQAVVHHHDVRRLDVTVHDVAVVRVGEAVGDLGGDVQRQLDRQRLARGQDRAQLLAFQELHGHVGHALGLADVVDGDDVRMVQPPGRARLLVEARFVLGHLVLGQGEVDGLDRHDAVEHRVARLVDDAHGALPELRQKLVAAELLGDLLGAHCVHHCLGMLAFTLLNTGPQIG